MSRPERLPGAQKLRPLLSRPLRCDAGHRAAPSGAAGHTYFFLRSQQLEEARAHPACGPATNGPVSAPLLGTAGPPSRSGSPLPGGTGRAALTGQRRGQRALRPIYAVDARGAAHTHSAPQPAPPAAQGKRRGRPLAHGAGEARRDAAAKPRSCSGLNQNFYRPESAKG